MKPQRLPPDMQSESEYEQLLKDWRYDRRWEAALQAMTLFIAGGWLTDPESNAKKCFKIADAMLVAERREGE